MILVVVKNLKGERELEGKQSNFIVVEAVAPRKAQSGEGEPVAVTAMRNDGFINATSGNCTFKGGFTFQTQTCLIDKTLIDCLFHTAATRYAMLFV